MKAVTLIVLDGFGIGPKTKANAISLARKPNFDRFEKSFSHCQLSASGLSVGLKDGENGNSEAGHSNLGAGRIVLQDKMYITDCVRNGTFFENTVLKDAFTRAVKHKSRTHLIGLLSDGQSAHSEPEHLEALLVMAKKIQQKEVYLHLFTDGRDCEPKKASRLIKQLEITLANIGVGKISTIGGRYYGMDRGNNWERAGLAYEAMVFGQGEVAESAYEAVVKSYRRGITDEFIKPTVIRPDFARIEDRDSVILFNLRSDRGRQISKAFVRPDECDSELYDCKVFLKFKNQFFATMVEFGQDIPSQVAFSLRRTVNTLPHFLGKYQSLRQLYIAEREKFAHVTFFFHGGTAQAERNETRVRIPSKAVATFDQAPEMSAREIADTVIDGIKKKLYSLIVANFANADMLGHTGQIAPTVQAVEFLDRQMGRIAKTSNEYESTLIITADHGNAEEMKGAGLSGMRTSHTSNPVPFYLIDSRYKEAKLNNGVLGDVAPTILEILGLPKPKEMTGQSLLAVK